MKEFFTGLFSSWKFWVVVAIIVIVIMVYNKGVSDQKTIEPEITEYTPYKDETEEERILFTQFANTEAIRISDGFQSFFSEWRLFYGDLSRLVIDCQKLNDKQLIYLNNLTNKKLYKIGKKTLVKEMEASRFYSFVGAYREFAKRLRNLGAK